MSEPQTRPINPQVLVTTHGTRGVIHPDHPVYGSSRMRIPGPDSEPHHMDRRWERLMLIATDAWCEPPIRLGMTVRLMRDLDDFVETGTIVCIRPATSDDFAEEIFALNAASGRWVFETDRGGLLIDFDNTARLLLDKPSRWHHLAYCYSGDALDNTTLRQGETLYVRGEDVHLDVNVHSWRPATDEDPKIPQSPDRR